MNRKQTVNQLYEQFLTTLLGDLQDSSKCSPGLYQVIRGVVQDNKELLDTLPNDSITMLEQKIASGVPFKFTSSTRTQAG